MIRSSWFMVDVPGKMGFPPSSSPRMHPASRHRRSQPLTRAAGQETLDCCKIRHNGRCHSKACLQACIASQPEELVMQNCATCGGMLSGGIAAITCDIVTHPQPVRNIFRAFIQLDFMWLL